jgi:chromosome segregation ATPase
LENRATGRYDALDRMSSKLRQLQEQRDALDALVEALRTEDRWLAYWAEALQDQLLELEGRPAKAASTVEAVHTALVDRDEALRRARQDPAGAHAVVAVWGQMWSLLAPNSSETAQSSRERGPGRARLKRGPRRLRS